MRSQDTKMKSFEAALQAAQSEILKVKTENNELKVNLQEAKKAQVKVPCKS